MAGSLRRVLKTKRALEDARAALDMLGHRLREDGPSMTREQIRERVLYAANKVNDVVPRSIIRDDQ